MTDIEKKALIATAQLAEARDKTLEEAARVAEEYNNHLSVGAAVSRNADVRDGLKSGAEVSRMISTAIRALKRSQP